MIGGVFDSCPGPLSLVPYNDLSAKCPWLKFNGRMFGSISVQHDTPLFFPFFMLPATYGYFRFTEDKKSIPRAICDAFGILPVSFKNYFKYDGAKEWAGPYLLKKEQEMWPLLFLYSKKDSLMPYLYVNHVVDAKKKQNSCRIIMSKLFEKSAHVAHMRKYPEVYKQEIKQFLDQCIEK